MFVHTFWKKFEKVDQNIHFLNAFLLSFIGILSLITNGFTIFYLLKYFYIYSLIINLLVLSFTYLTKFKLESSVLKAE
jgi:hypothetical protein